MIKKKLNERAREKDRIKSAKSRSRDNKQRVTLLLHITLTVCSFLELSNVSVKKQHIIAAF